ncbi:MAG: cob(I)yrinic acid a,c-diamide adenosyltransferase [Nitrososphaeria archaeon]|nr:cob(I)yrinic acid a,c-diamide adenosyltransferase [Nitrososphaeria archaeon]
MKIYTKTGDDGTTGVQGGKRISKSDPRIQAYGAVDEANSILGIVLTHKLDSDVQSLLVQIQNELFVAGSDLSSPDLVNQKNRVSESMICNLESHIDRFESELDPLTNFILPGGNQVAAFLHQARTVIRRAETMTVELSKKESLNPLCQKYLNRLSDLLFVMARVANKRSNTSDVLWKP